MHYADSSFLVSLVTTDAGTESARSTFWKLGRPPFVFTPFHEAEVSNALRLIEFIEVRNSSGKNRAEIVAKHKRAAARVWHILQRGSWIRTRIDWESVMGRFETLSASHTSTFGTRTLDILHVASALELNCRHFITCDERQAALAKAAGLKVRHVEIDE